MARAALVNRATGPVQRRAGAPPSHLSSELRSGCWAWGGLVAALVSGAACPGALAQPRTLAPLDDDLGGRWTADGEPAEVVVMGRSYRVEPDAAPRGVVVIGGDLDVAGRVDGDAVAVGGSVRVEPGAVVTGDVVTLGGELLVSTEARVGGERVSLGRQDWGRAVRDVTLRVDRELPVVTLGVLFRLSQVIAALLLGLLALALMPERMRTMRVTLEHAPGRSTLIGLGLLVGFVPFCLLLAISILGLPFIPLAVLLLLVLLVLGLSALALLIGHTFGGAAGDRSPWVAMAIGYAVIALIAVIPVLGTIAVPLAAFIGAGAVLSSRFGGGPKRQTPEGRRVERDVPPHGTEAVAPGEPAGAARPRSAQRTPTPIAPQGAWRLPPSETEP